MTYVIGKEQYMKMWHNNHPDYRRKYEEKRRNYYKIPIFTALNWKCACCDFNCLDVLQIDHIDGNGKQHRKNIKGSSAEYYHDIWSHLGDFQLLCGCCHILKTKGLLK